MSTERKTCYTSQETGEEVLKDPSEMDFVKLAGEVNIYEDAEGMMFERPATKSQLERAYG